MTRAHSDFEALPKRSFRAILADPPWRFVTFTDAVPPQSRKPERHYATMSFGDLVRLPVHRLAHPEGASLVMWTTFPMLPQALSLMQAWGFAYSSGGAWGKQSRTGNKIAFGTGYLFRSAAELYLVGTVGRPRIGRRPGATSVRNLILAPTREHSRKPDELYRDIETLFDGPYLELFARSRHRGWTSWGNEVGKF